MKKKLISLAVGAFLLATPAMAWADEVTGALTLDDSIRIALENNLDVKISDKDVDVAKKNYSAAKNARWGGLTFTNSFTKYQSNRRTADKSYGDSLMISIPVFSGGKLEAQQRQGKYNWQNAKMTLQRTVESTIYNTEQTYYTVLKNERLIKVNNEYLEGMNEHLRVAKAKFDNGMVAKIDVLNAEVEVSKAKENLIASQNDLDLARSRFNNILNRALSTPVDLVDNQESDVDFPYSGLTAPELIDRSYINRQEIKIAENNVKIAKEDVKIQQADFLPTLNVTGGYSWTSSDHFFDHGAWEVGLNSTWKLAPATKSAVDAAKASVEKAEILLDQKKQNIALEVQEAYINVVNAEQTVATCKTNVEQAKEANKIAAIRYREGVGTSTERIDAQTELTRAQTNYENALFGLNTARAALEKAVGQSVVVE